MEKHEKIEITPQMIEAGVAVLEQFTEGMAIYGAFVVEQVYSAMAALDPLRNVGEGPEASQSRPHSKLDMQ
ncbi:MAG: hypothetical protein ACT4N4_08325 [Rhodospirillales bacterium]